MASAASRAVDRRFRLAGFSERDSLVVRSMVRLLAGRTRDRWSVVDADPVHLVIVPVGFTGELPPGAAGMNVALPLRADDLWSQLDRVSGQLALDEGMLRPGRADNGDVRPVAAGPGRRLQLLRWPPDALLGSDLRYLRLATMLGARPFAIDELSAKSNIPLATCHAFAAVLHANGVAQWLIDPDDPHADEAGNTGLFSRIRSKLGLEGPR